MLDQNFTEAWYAKGVALHNRNKRYNEHHPALRSSAVGYRCPEVSQR